MIERLKEVINIEATTIADGDFLLTHVPFENLFLYEKGTRVSEKSISEEQFYTEQLLEHEDEHKFVIVQGSPGCGKSHLIRWMYERFRKECDPQREAILFISRSRNTLQDAIEQILKSDIFSDDIKNHELKRIKDAHKGRTGEELSRQIAFEFCQAVHRDDNNDNCVVDRRCRDWLKVFLLDPFIQEKFLLCAKGPVERIHARLEYTEGSEVDFDESPIFTEASFAMDVAAMSKLKDTSSRAAEFTIKLGEFLNTRADKDAQRAKIAAYLNSKISEVIENSILYNATDFRKLFQALRKQLKQQGKNLTLFIEDITSLSGLDRALMEELIANHQTPENADYCRITSFLGTTQKVYDDSIPTNYKDRVTTNILIKEATVLGEIDKLAQFAARYMNAINLNKAVVDRWALSGAKPQNAPLSNANVDIKWSLVDIGGRIISIYPFNKRALWNLYQTIAEDRRTPRMFLRSVLRHVLANWCTLGKERFLLEENIFSNGEIKVPIWFEPIEMQLNKNYNVDYEIPRGILLRIWGNRTTQKVGDCVGEVEKAIFENFGIPTDIFDQKEGANQPPVLTGTGAGTGNPPPPLPPTTDEYQKLCNKLTEWFEKKEELAEHIELRDLMRQRILDAIDWEAEGVSPQFVRLFDDRYRLSVEGQKAGMGAMTYTIKRSDDALFALMAVAAYRYRGNRSWDTGDGGVSYINFMVWFEKNKADIIYHVKNPKGALTDVGYLNIVSEYGCKLLTGQVKPNMSEDELYVALCEDIKPVVSIGHSETWRDTQKLISEKGVDLHRNNLGYFSKNWGDILKESMQYRFLDAHEIYCEIENFKKAKFDLAKIELPSGFADEKIYGLPIYIIAALVKRLDSLASAEKKLVEDSTMILRAAIGEDYSKEVIGEAINEISLFLNFLGNELNLAYTVDDYLPLSNRQIKPEILSEQLVLIRELSSELTNQQLISKLTEVDISFLLLCSDVFRKFNALIMEKKNLLKGGGTAADVTELAKVRKNVKDEAAQMKKLIGGGI